MLNKKNTKQLKPKKQATKPAKSITNKTNEKFLQEAQEIEDMITSFEDLRLFLAGSSE